ncbi:MAG: rhodanese-like domain-containing protein [Verrucomicrobia bacterium]|nr:rhodanese-like domain-containing protein [Verrucomicrobiota bacterium]MDA1066722.1 rhodanese-like domain-containing protein [Verrucomicrobiota bacterium]
MKSRITISILIFVGLAFSSCTKKTDEVWIDVRTLEEFDSGHLEEAFHIPHEQIADCISEVTANKDAIIHLYCRSGGRAGRAKTALEELGFINVLNDGGYEEILKSRQGTEL